MWKYASVSISASSASMPGASACCFSVFATSVEHLSGCIGLPSCLHPLLLVLSSALPACVSVAPDCGILLFHFFHFFPQMGETGIEINGVGLMNILTYELGSRMELILKSRTYCNGEMEKPQHCCLSPVTRIGKRGTGTTIYVANLRYLRSYSLYDTRVGSVDSGLYSGRKGRRKFRYKICWPCHLVSHQGDLIQSLTSESVSY